MKYTGWISVIILFIYSVSTFVGVGVVRCGCTNSHKLVILSFHPSCLCSDSADDCCPHNDQYQDVHGKTGCHDENCCSVVYKYVNAVHLKVTPFNDHPAKVVSLLFFSHISVNKLFDNIKECAADIRNNSPPFFSLKIPLIYMHGQLRL